MNPARMLVKGMVWACVGLCALALLDGCQGKPQPEARRAPDATYTVRGQVASVPIPGNKKTQFAVKHEAIDNFRSMSGKVTGMNSMTMEFPPAPGVSLEGIKPGDVVELTFSVWWGEADAWNAVKVVKLPAETTLTFGKAKPPAAGSPNEPSPAAPEPSKPGK